MNTPVYPVTRLDNKLTFYFISRDSFGENPVLKIITHAVYHRHGVAYYNLGFGDLEPKSHEISDTNLIDGVYLVKGGSSEKIESFQRGKDYECLLISLARTIFLFQEPEEFYVMANSKKSIQEQELEKKFLKFMSTRTTEDVFPEKNRKAWENLKRAGLIKD